MVTTTTERVDEGINHYTVDLHAPKNSFLPIFRLPPETLENIFTHGARNYHESDDYPPFGVPRWVRVSYVCRFWRNVALNCPTLWTYHFTASLRWTEELLARSKQASLKIRIRYYHDRAMPWWSHLVEKVLNHAERIQELRLSIPVKPLLAGISLYAPRLQILDIYTWDRPSEQTFMINNGDTLPLHTLKLNDCSLPWYSFNLSGVTTLFLSCFSFPFQQNITEFLATLSRMQALTVIHIQFALPSARDSLSSAAFRVPPKVNLPCLVRLFVAAPLSTVVVLLSCINIPLETQLRLKIKLEDGSSIDDYAQFPPVLAQRFSQSKDLTSSYPTNRSLVIGSMNDSKFTICASEHGDCDSRLWMVDFQRDCDLPLMIDVEMNQSMANRHRIVGDICCSIPSTHVENLDITYPPSSLDFWRKTLAHLDGLRRMKLRYGPMPDLASLLTLVGDKPVEALEDDNHISTPGHTFVPALEELELERITFTSEDKLSGNIISESVLRDALSTRGALRPHLTMTRCDVKVSRTDQCTD